jgi:hypothetical protein
MLTNRPGKVQYKNDWDHYKSYCKEGTVKYNKYYLLGGRKVGEPLLKNPCTHGIGVWR